MLVKEKCNICVTVVLNMRLYKNPLRRRETRLGANSRMFEADSLLKYFTKQSASLRWSPRE